ncbi:MAG TPA: hypothetical protein VMV18_09125 [bacterium]|nr:hypothetical protein [bacterium]
MRIATCEICLPLAQEIELDYKADGEKEKPKELGRLVTLATVSEDGETAEAWSSSAVARCPVCATHYLLQRSVDEGHSFMDPTWDDEYVRRLTPLTAISWLSQLAAATTEAARAAIEEARAPTAREAETMLREQRAPNWHLQRHAIEVLLDECLAGGEVERLEAALLRHPDPGVRAEAALDALLLARDEHYGGPRLFTAEIGAAASTWLAELDARRAIANVLVGVLAAPPRPALHFDFGKWWPCDSHARARSAFYLLVDSKNPAHRQVARYVVDEVHDLGLKTSKETDDILRYFAKVATS